MRALKLLADGHRPAEIAKALGIKRELVERYLERGTKRGRGELVFSRDQVPHASQSDLAAALRLFFEHERRLSRIFIRLFRVLGRKTKRGRKP